MKIGWSEGKNQTAAIGHSNRILKLEQHIYIIFNIAYFTSATIIIAVPTGSYDFCRNIINILYILNMNVVSFSLKKIVTQTD